MASSNTQEKLQVDEATRYVLDKLIQDLTMKLLPILQRGSRCHVECDQSGKKGEPAKLKITEFVN